MPSNAFNRIRSQNLSTYALTASGTSGPPAMQRSINDVKKSMAETLYESNNHSVILTVITYFTVIATLTK